MRHCFSVPHKPLILLNKMAGEPGLEPGLTVSETAVLPLNDSPPVFARFIWRETRKGDAHIFVRGRKGKSRFSPFLTI